MKPIMHLYSDKVTITDKKELMPLMKSSSIHVAASEESGIIYVNVSKEKLDDFLSKDLEHHPGHLLLKLALELAPEVRTVSNLQIADDDTVSIEETVKADILMINKDRMVIIAGVDDKLYTNNVEAAKQCVNEGIIHGKFAAVMLERIIIAKGMVECKLKVE